MFILRVSQGDSTIALVALLMVSLSLQTVCTYWLKGLCMKGEECGFLHQLDPQRMPVCRTLLKFGECKDPECPFKHNLEEVKVSARTMQCFSLP